MGITYIEGIVTGPTGERSVEALSWMRDIVEHAQKGARECILVYRRKLDVAQMWSRALASSFG